jgi:23S rRNA (adenine1618-N6)-methyltransferase
LAVNIELWCAMVSLPSLLNDLRKASNIPSKFFWFTTLVSKKDNLKHLPFIKQSRRCRNQTIGMAQGQKISRVVALTFFEAISVLISVSV